MKGIERADDVVRVHIVADLLALVAKDRVGITRDRALRPVRQPPRKQTVGVSK
jgi:hypothetical protein